MNPHNPDHQQINWQIDPNNLAQDGDLPIISALYKTHPQDFIVEEKLDIPFVAGEHLWLLVQKQNMNTAFLARLLAKWANIPPKDVGFSGLKDRHAQTQQWFSLRLPKKQAPSTPFCHQTDHESAHVLAQDWHNKKLARATHKHNHFIITLRQVAGDCTAIENRLQHLKKWGIPNYFGTQRFGHQGKNLDFIQTFFTKQTAKSPTRQSKFFQKNREKIAIGLSAARSLIFNQILHQRVQDGSWQTGLDGEIFNLNGSNAIFYSEKLDDTLKNRLAIGDIHPTAPLWGQRPESHLAPSPRHTLEQTLLARQPILQNLANHLENYGMKSTQRPLRILPDNLTWHWQDTLDLPTLTLAFDLPTGSFATAVLMALGKVRLAQADQMDDEMAE